MSELDALKVAVEELRSREAIRTLIARYGFVIDDRDMPGIASLFTENAYFGSADGVMGAHGRDAIVEQFRQRFAVLGMSNHFTHDHVVDFVDAHHATGLVNSHAEVFRNGSAMLAALRYEDRYERAGDGAWKFASRHLRFGYYLPVKDYADQLGNVMRMCAYEAPAAADWPERTETFQAYVAAAKTRD